MPLLFRGSHNTPTTYIVSVSCFVILEIERGEIVK